MKVMKLVETKSPPAGIKSRAREVIRNTKNLTGVSVTIPFMGGESVYFLETKTFKYFVEEETDVPCLICQSPDNVQELCQSCIEKHVKPIIHQSLQHVLRRIAMNLVDDIVKRVKNHEVS